MVNQSVFDELFVLELANNHWGSLERGLRIIQEFSKVVRYNNVRAAIKLQVRDVDSFVHKSFRGRDDIRYIKKTVETRMSREHLAEMAEAIRRSGCIRMATAFDEESVDTCLEIGVEILKLASSDINDWVLIEKMGRTRKPIIASTGGSSVKDVDDLVKFCENRNIPLALNHCVALYPTEDSELELNQIDFLRGRYPNLTIGLSTHEYKDWTSSIVIAYAKGARTFERHIDIRTEDKPFSPYCTDPEQCDVWFRSFKKVKEMCGPPGNQKRIPTDRETKYLDALVRGVYAARDLPVGHILTERDVYLAVPLQKGQISCRELMSGDVLVKAVSANEPVLIDCLDSPYAKTPSLRDLIMTRGL
ncbi:MAG: N-acetylneuraminate synthase family protein [Deltaproteobacteria bacterium]|nr:N-acetylneuraminate synthase family protein [Deltaproteobacteria bacterium]